MNKKKPTNEKDLTGDRRNKFHNQLTGGLLTLHANEIAEARH